MNKTIHDAIARAGRPLSLTELFEETGDRKATVAALDAMLAAGRLIETRKHRFALPEQTGLIHGRIQGSSRGFGFLTPDGGGADVYLPPDGMRGAMHQDEAYVRVTAVSGRSGHAEAEVFAITKRALRYIIGTYRDGCVVPDESRLPFDLPVVRGGKNAQNNDKVVAEIVQYPDGRRPCMGRIREVLGRTGAPGVDILTVIRRMDLNEEFQEGVRRVAAAMPQSVSEQEKREREDLTDWQIVTIDGAYTKDFDDAISLTSTETGNRLLGVHIADVSAYVPARGAIDREALARGTSVYFPDRVLPMLPEELSNGICSLNPGVERLTLSCFMELDEAGRVLRHRIAETVICSKHRLIYGDVTALLAGDPALLAEYADVAPMLKGLEALHLQLRARRISRGAIDFDTAEPDVRLDEAGRVVSLERRTRGVADCIIEECMILANEVVATHMAEAGAPFLYRVHERPDPAKLAQVHPFLSQLGVPVVADGAAEAAAIRAALQKTRGTPQETVVSKLLLTSMQKARYSDQNIGHFGLASPCYCHFTSPIRRYPDLIGHRILKMSLHGELNRARVERLAGYLPGVAEASSEAERAANEAERAVDRMKAAEYMARHIGETYQGVVSGVTGFGVFVELSNTAEGLIRLPAFDDDFYVYNADRYCVTGRVHKRQVRLGDPIRVRVQHVDLAAGAIDFTPETDYDTMHIRALELKSKPERGAKHGRKKKRQAAGAKPKGKA